MKKFQVAGFKFQVVLLVVIVLLMLAGPAAAQGPGDSPLPTPTASPTPAPVPWEDRTPTPQEFLGWLALGGAPLIGALTALLQRKSRWFQNLSSDGKWWVSFGLGAGLPALAGLLLLYVPSAFWEAITPIWMIVLTAILGYLGKESVYLLLVKPNTQIWDIAIEEPQE
ncbi:MAG: hypothetical protein JXA21_11335 [Anaerolineae bacterium]|nr:hypothetical protein [Anaerolineae bacterium]